jgi:hypothetical protein
MIVLANLGSSKLMNGPITPDHAKPSIHLVTLSLLTKKRGKSAKTPKIQKLRTSPQDTISRAREVHRYVGMIHRISTQQNNNIEQCHENDPPWVAAQ